MKTADRSQITLASPALRFDCDPNTGRFSIGRPAAPPVIHNATARARFDRLTLDTFALQPASIDRRSIDDAHGRAERLTIEFQPAASVELSLQVTLYAAHPFLSMRLAAQNQSSRALAVQQLTPLRTAGGAIRFGQSPAPLTFFKNGYQSWSYTGMLRAEQRDVGTRLGSHTRPLQLNLTTPLDRRPGVFWSEMFGALIDPAARLAIIAGQIGAADQFAQVFADTRPGRAALSLTCALDGVPLVPGQSIASEEMLIQLIDLPADDPLADYVEAVARRMQPRVTRLPNPGWCSWYCHFGAVGEEAVNANLQTARDWRDSIPLDLIQIDDGYQTRTGDWLSINGKFPRGMASLAERIRAAGHTPGLWLAPFIAVPSSQTAGRHPDWFLRDERGRPVIAGKGWGENNVALDLTHPGAQDDVRHVVETVVREWGFPYLKLDFLYAAALPGRRRDRSATRAQALRRGLELIREAAGEEAFLLGCGCPMGQAIGLVDGMRIGPDIAPEPAPTWLPRYKGVSFFFGREAGLPAARNAVRNVLTRSSLHRKWWINDPDCLIVRPARHMSEVEVRSWASLVGLSGGLLVAGDDLPALPLQRRRYLASIMPVLSEGARPLDLFEREMP